MRTAVTEWLHEHASELRLAGAETGRALAHILIGMIIGAMMSLREAREGRSDKPLTRALNERAGGSEMRSGVSSSRRSAFR